MSAIWYSGVNNISIVVYGNYIYTAYTHTKGVKNFKCFQSLRVSSIP